MWTNDRDGMRIIYLTASALQMIILRCGIGRLARGFAQTFSFSHALAHLSTPFHTAHDSPNPALVGVPCVSIGVQVCGCGLFRHSFLRVPFFGGCSRSFLVTGSEQADYVLLQSSRQMLAPWPLSPPSPTAGALFLDHRGCSPHLYSLRLSCPLFPWFSLPHRYRQWKTRPNLSAVCNPTLQHA